MLTNSIGLFFISFLSSTLLLPFVKKFGINNQIIDSLNARKLKDIKLVRTGGLSIISGFVISIFFILFTYQDIDIKTLMTIFLGGFFYFLIGLFDDMKSTSPYLRLFLQFFIATILWFSGIRIYEINLDFIGFGNFVFPRILSLSLTIIWISAVINAINWFDGLDGLAAGTTSIICLALFVISFSIQNVLMIYLLAALTGSCFGFLRYNTFPSRILMGDCGSYFLGFNLAILSMLASSSTNLNTNFAFGVIFLLIPLLDMIYVIFSRLKKGASPYFPDMSHLHHRLMNTGLSHKNTVIMILSILHIYNCLILLFIFKIKLIQIVFISLFLSLIYFALKITKRISKYTI